METTAIHVSKEAYNRAARYAQSHNTSVEKMTENFFLTLVLMGQKNNSHDMDKKKAWMDKKKSWREMEIPEEVRKMSLPKIPGFPDDDKNMLETILREKYESLS